MSLSEKALQLGFPPHQVYQADLLLENFAPRAEESLFWFLLFEASHRDRGHLRLALDAQGLARSLEDWDWNYNLEEDVEALRQSAMAAIRGQIDTWLKDQSSLFSGEEAPYIVKKQKLYTRRQLRREERLLESFRAHLQGEPSFLQDLGPEELESALTALDPESRSRMNEQILQAFQNLGRHPVSVISGGPGTGKTTSLVYILRLLREVEKGRGREFQLVLCAPTGRAAKRMEEALSFSGELEAFTLHKLLGLGRSRGPKWSAEHPLPADLVVVDEASMVDIGVMQRLLESLSPETALLLIGDKDQLPSVESGALLGDMLQHHEEEGHPLKGAVTLLEKVYRSDRDILELASAVRLGDASILDRLQPPGLNKPEAAVSLQAFPPDLREIPSWMVEGFRLAGADRGFDCAVEDREQVRVEIDRWFELYRSLVILCPMRKGLWGVDSLNDRIRRGLFGDTGEVFQGLPIMITRNDYELNLFNGDRGVLFRFQNLYYALFPAGEDAYQAVALSYLKHWELCFAQTIHKSQGSEYQRVIVLLPPGGERMLYRELLYTAITRARKELFLLADPSGLSTCLKRGIIRDSGLREFFSGGKEDV